MKKLFQSILLFFSLLLLNTPVQALDGISQLKTFTKTVQSARGEFLQQQIANQLGADNKPKILRQFSGQFNFVRPSKFTWITIKPYEQKLISDGKQLIMWDKDLNQVTYRPAGKALATTPIAILFGTNQLDEFFELMNKGENNGISWVELIPKAAKKGLDDLAFNKIGIGMKDNLPVAMELRDALDNTILLTFSQVKTNLPISNDEFNFSVPPNAEIVKLK
ncbi:outer membrane lipoprotein carrier protein LolA [Polynucleobacter kasalickyi]|uniref:Outer-membrane lipoprotein carrier protein n=1 Tax=Polynucleobacter kasalickyi TaxID=1938817 RepID=A0A1W1Y4M5_9BURK|nr:outer membrane lipoprotein carrier protein LolA [Polynucleobacter kasalickyi]SMC30781.1 outer membrane lipoprotein carrier protein [Polynucleobacter kasalickyi]